MQRDFGDGSTPPDQLRWDPLPIPEAPTDFVDGMVTHGRQRRPAAQTGLRHPRVRVPTARWSAFFYDADGELLIVPQQGRLGASPPKWACSTSRRGEIAVIPRGVRFRVDLPDGAARGYVCENYGAPFRLPDLGPIGSNGLANPRDFLAPVAAYEDREGAFELVARSSAATCGSRAIDHSPLDVVAWHGNYAPYKYDLAPLQRHRLDQLRPSRSVDLHGAARRAPTPRAWPTSTS